MESAILDALKMANSGVADLVEGKGAIKGSKISWLEDQFPSNSSLESELNFALGPFCARITGYSEVFSTETIIPANQRGLRFLAISLFHISPREDGKRISLCEAVSQKIKACVEAQSLSIKPVSVCNATHWLIASGSNGSRLLLVASVEDISG